MLSLRASSDTSVTPVFNSYKLNYKSSIDAPSIHFQIEIGGAFPLEIYCSLGQLLYKIYLFYI